MSKPKREPISRHENNHLRGINRAMVDLFDERERILRFFDEEIATLQKQCWHPENWRTEDGLRCRLCWKENPVNWLETGEFTCK